MERPRLALAAICLPLTLLVQWGAPHTDPGPGRPASQPAAGPAAPRPPVVPRKAWGADEKLVREAPVDVDRVRAVFVHHTDHPGGYACGDVPAMLRALEKSHIRSKGWDDIGYNYLVDRCGTVYEGRNSDRGTTVRGAHTQGFNTQSVGIAAIGSFAEGAEVPRQMLAGIAAVAAWQLEPGADPHGRVRLTSTNGRSLYSQGDTASLRVISGHRDAFETTCPGDALHGELPRIRDEVERRRR